MASAGSWLSRHSQVLSYLFVTGVMVLALAGYQRHVARELGKADRISCQNRRTLIHNQRLVLDILAKNTAELAFDNSLNVRTQQYFARAHDRVIVALFALEQMPPPCE